MGKELSSLRRAAKALHKANPSDVRADVHSAAIKHARNREDAEVAAIVARMNATELWLFIDVLPQLNQAASLVVLAAIRSRIEAEGMGAKSLACGMSKARAQANFYELKKNGG